MVTAEPLGGVVPAEPPDEAVPADPLGGIAPAEPPDRATPDTTETTDGSSTRTDQKIVPPSASTKRLPTARVIVRPLSAWVIV